MKPCDLFKKYESGEISSADFENHLPDCQKCRAFKKQDDQLMAMATDLNTAIEVPDLWPKMKNNLMLEKAELKQTATRHRFFGDSVYLKLAAALLIFASLTALYLVMDKIQNPSGLLNQTALERVENTEQEYIAAISDLEKQAGEKMARMDLHLMLLYRDKLETIDGQIEQCKRALQDNPANTHIRRYLLAALIDKKESLLEIIHLQLDG